MGKGLKNMSHDFKICNFDSDSIMYCKKDMSPFSKEERDFLLKDLNKLYPEFIVFEEEGY